MSIGENIKRFREEKHLTQTQLSESLGVDQSYIAKVENNIRIPSIMFCEAAAKIFGCTLNDLVNRDSPETA